MSTKAIFYVLLYMVSQSSLGFSQSFVARLSSWNMLAPSYVKHEYYPHADKTALSWTYRQSLLPSVFKKINADIYALQEVEPKMFEEVGSILKAHKGLYTKQFREDKADGLALFYKSDRFKLLSTQTLRINETKIAQVTRLSCLASHRVITIVNLKIPWVSPKVQASSHPVSHELQKLLQQLKLDFSKEAVVVCGDLNVLPNTLVPLMLEQLNLIDAFKTENKPTIFANKQYLRVDYIFHSQMVKATVVPTEELSDKSKVPSATWPSDHLALSVDFSSELN